MPPRLPAVAVAALLALAAPAVAANALDPSPDAAVDRMKKDIFFLAGDECEGRGIETKGILKAGGYVADAFRDAGLKPAGPTGSYFQPFTIPGPSRLGTPNTLTLVSPDGRDLPLAYGTDFTPTAMSGSGKRAAGLAFVGYGITSDKPKYDDYAGVDAKGKIVVVLRRAPRYGKADAVYEANSPHPSLAGKVENAAKHGAVGVVFVNDATEDGDGLMDFAYARGPAAGFPVVQVKRAVADAMLAGSGTTLAAAEKGIAADLKPRSAELKGWRAAVEVTVTKTTLSLRNVVGVADGSGPLADETIVIGAHYDHLGRGEPGSLGGPAGKGQIHYGADDNGSGTTGLMELARRFGAMRGRVGRRIVFVAFSGEERGLFGSQYYCREPLFPLDTTAFMLNLDMIGRVTRTDDDAALVRAAALTGAAAGANVPNAVVKRDRIVVYGTGTADGMDALVTGVNLGFGFKLLKEPGGAGPSDHAAFNAKGIPVLFLFSGTHRDYHKPTDTPDKINLPGMAKVVGLSEALAYYFASAPARPKFQKTRGGWEDPTDPATQANPHAGTSGRPSGPRLGILFDYSDMRDAGAVVDSVSPGGAADKGGLKPEDVVVEIAGRPVKNVQGYMAAMAGQKPGREIEVVVQRKGTRVTLKAVPQE